MIVETSGSVPCALLAHDAFAISILNVRITRMRRALEFIRDHAGSDATKLFAESALENDELLF